MNLAKISAFFLITVCAGISLTSCQKPEILYFEEAPRLVSVNIVDRNGLSETISNSERLSQFENVNFLTSQPYRKVLRIYNRDIEGKVHARITSYHTNGVPKQYLEVVNNSAHGVYKEWHDNGRIKIEGYIEGGEADLDIGAQKTWIFHNNSRVWDENGNLLGEFPYRNGKLEGIALYYHSNGKIWKRISYLQGDCHGTMTVYLNNGAILSTAIYDQGKKQGLSERFWVDGTIAAEENYDKGLLRTGQYFDIEGSLVSEVILGNGYRSIFGRSYICELQQIKNGVQCGEVKQFDEDGEIYHSYGIKNEIKHGTEVFYYSLIESEKPQTPKLSIHWVEGKIQGITKTWYLNGVQESQREMSGNKKNGLLTAWYLDGSVMLIEEYEQDKLIKGEYFAKGQTLPVSSVIGGKGVATFFDSEGHYIQKISYENSKPLE